jgi:enoyl-CoA hydratase/carnithine racemase
MVQEFGWANAQRYLLTGDEFNSAEAHRIGLVQEVHPVGKHLERAHEMAEKIAKQAPLAVYASLKNSRIAQQQAEAAAIARMMADLAPLMSSEDVKEGVQSFVERREAKFQGK